MTIFRAFPVGHSTAAINTLRTQHFSLVKRWKSSQFLTDDYQYLQRGQIPMLHFQRSLPHLPVPELEKTCQRYLAAIAPLVKDADDLKRVQSVVQNFQTGIGASLQKMLVDHDKANRHTSYISEPWFDMYLADRKPLPINYNPVLIMKLDEINSPEYNDQLVRAGNLIISTLRFMRSLRENVLDPEVYHMDARKSDTNFYRRVVKMAPQAIATFVSYAFKAFPLDMSQYQGLFGATRIPETGKDRIYRAQDTTHICVLKQGHIYAVNVLDNDGNISSPKVILNRLKHVYNSAEAQSPAEYPMGLLTTEDRDTWATVRQHLVNTHNNDALKTIDSALFCVALDDENRPVDEFVNNVQNFLHGKDGGVINRWYDKSLSLLVSKNGLAAINFEHSWGDGVAILRLFNEIYKDTTERPWLHPADLAVTNEIASDDASDAVVQLEFNLDELSKKRIREAQAKHAAVLDSLDTNFMIYFDMNKNTCKQHRVSPDSIMQLGFQLAYLKQNNEYVGTYESCSTAAFRHGRTECVRSCTTTTKAACDAIVKARPSGLTDPKLRELVVACSAVHGQLIKEAAMGQGIDRHLFGLRHIGEVNGIAADPLYSDESFKKLNCNILSTSSLASPGLYNGGFGPVESNGYGIGYCILDIGLGTLVTNYKSQRNGSEFAECLKESYDDLKNILELKKVEGN